MKKLLSMILACAMVMSLFCAIPAGAADASVEHSFPYIIETFEDGDVSFLGASTDDRLIPGELESVVTAAGEGYGASENAAKVTYIGSGTNNNVIGNYLYNSNGEKITVSAKKGDVFTATFWMKSEQNLAATNILLVLWSDTYWKNNAQVTFDGANKGWQKVTMSYTFPADYEVDTIELRFGNTGKSNLDADDSSADRVYLVDNFEMKIGKEFTTETVYDFTGISTGSMPASSVMSTAGILKSKSAQPDPENSSNQTLKFIFADRTFQSEPSNKPDIFGSNYGIIHWYDNSKTVKTGDKITVSFDVYVDSTYYSTGTMKVSTKIYARDTSNQASFTSASNYESFIDMSKLDQWQTITYDLGTATANATFYDYYMYIRQDNYAAVGNELYQEGTTADGKAYKTYMLSETVMYFDNLKVDIEPVTGDTVTPVVTGASAIMDAYTGIVTPDYTFTTPGGATPVDASYYKLLDGDKVITSFAKGADIVVPDAYKTSENLKLTIVPYSADGYFGEEVTTAIGAEYEIDLEASDITFTSNGVEAEVGFKHLNSGGTTANVLFIVCAYDANGALIDYGLASIVCAPGATADADPVADGVQNPTAKVTAANIASAKAFLWGCGEETPTTVFGTAMIQLHESVSAEK